MVFPDVIQDLISYFELLPGIGTKTAQRLVFYLLQMPDRELKSFGSLLASLKDNTQLCSVCKNITSSEKCSICADASRDHRQILVVASPLDVVALEKTHYRGTYHVLHGLIDPLNYVGPDDIYIQSLLERLIALQPTESNPVEVVIATNASMEGESTALYLKDAIRSKFSDKGVRVTRIGRGLPVGGDIEYADDHTLTRALEGRQQLD